MDKPEKKTKIDAHAHVFLASLKMLKNRRYTPAYDAAPQSYFQHLKSEGLNGALLIQPSFLGMDNSYLLNTILDAKQSEPDLLVRGVAVLNPSTSIDEMQVLKKAGITGIRLNCVSQAVPELDQPIWRQYLKRVEKLNWHVEVQIEGKRLMPLLNQLIKTNKRIVIDHFGLPNITASHRCSGFNSLLKNTAPDVCVKLSAPYRVFPDQAPEHAAQACDELARQLLDSIGPGRLIWGSDWPWTQHETEQDYAACLRWGKRWFRYKNSDAGMVPNWLMEP